MSSGHITLKPKFLWFKFQSVENMPFPPSFLAATRFLRTLTYTDKGVLVFVLHSGWLMMNVNSILLTCRVTITEEPGGLRSKGSHRVGDDWATSLSFFTFMHWRRKWQPTPAFLPGESTGSHRVRHDWSDLAAAGAVWPLIKLDKRGIFPYHHYHSWQVNSLVEIRICENSSSKMLST